VNASGSTHLFESSRVNATIVGVGGGGKGGGEITVHDMKPPCLEPTGRSSQVVTPKPLTSSLAGTGTETLLRVLTRVISLTVSIFAIGLQRLRIGMGPGKGAVLAHLYAMLLGFS
jgi:hypothetical protein